jgi:signal transduction histidine kinase
MTSVYDPIPLARQRTLVWSVAALSAATAIMYFLAGWRSGDLSFAAGSIGPAMVAVVAVTSVRIGKGQILPILLAASAAIVIEDQLLGIDDIASTSAIPLAIVAVAGAFFVPGRWVAVYAAAYAAVIFVSRFQWSQEDTHLLQATVAAASVALGALLVALVRRGFDEREHRFQSLFQNAPVSMWQEDFSQAGAQIAALTDDGIGDLEAYFNANPEEVRRLAALVRVKDVNDAALALTEAPSRDVLIGRFAMDTFSRGALESFIPQFMAIADDLENVSTELKGGLTVTGRPIEAILVWSAPRVDGALDLANVTVAIVDITRQREVERELHGLLNTKDQLVATVSHEIRTPLTAVVGIAEELRDPGSVADETEREELLGIIAEQSLEVSRIVEDLLVVARSDAGNLVVDPQPINLAEEALKAIASIGRDIPIEIESNSTVVADPQRVRQILRNLVSNAQRYGGPDIRVVVGEEGTRSVVEVRDNGDSLPAAGRAVVFEPYGRSDKGEKSVVSVGLGLTVSRRLARHMGGDLTYDHDGHEAIFALTLATAPRPVPAV